MFRENETEMYNGIMEMDYIAQTEVSRKGLRPLERDHQSEHPMHTKKNVKGGLHPGFIAATSMRLRYSLHRLIEPPWRNVGVG